MTMVDESTIELIHAEVDGRLSAAQRAELSRRLLADQDARALQREMSALRDLLAAVPAAEVPRDVAPAILAALPSVTETGASTARHFGRRGWVYFGAMAVAAGLVGIALLLDPEGSRQDTSAAIGTMAANALPGAIAINDPAIRGTVTLRTDGRALALDFDVSLQEEVSIVALGGGSPLARVERSPSGPQSERFSLELPGATVMPGPIVLRISAGDRLIDEVQLGPPDG
jgi:hypothetical protein